MNCVWIVLLFFWNSFNLSSAQNSMSFKNSSVTSYRKPGELCMNKCQHYYGDKKFNGVVEIAGGTKSFGTEFPHMAAIGYDKDNNTTEWLCGGSLISKKFVLTAAHCITANAEGPKYVRLGDLDLSTDKDNAKPQNFKIVRSIPHPSHSPPSRYHDIALLELEKEAEFNGHVSPACLNTEKEFNMTKLIATGWGKTAYTEDTSSSLLKVILDLVSNDTCMKAYRKVSKNVLPNGVVDEFQICAGKVKGQDTCQGDSGGPLQLLVSDKFSDIRVYNIFGITSFGKACALSEAPGIYTRISSYIPWIESIAWENETL